MVLVAMLIFLIQAILSIIIYNQNVRLYHWVGASQKNLEQLRISNVELKNQLYSVVELDNVDALAAKLGLIKEKRPDYLARQ